MPSDKTLPGRKSCDKNLPVKAFTHAILRAKTSIRALRNVLIRTILMRSEMEENDYSSVVRPSCVPIGPSWRSVRILRITFESSEGKARTDFNDVCINTMLRSWVRDDIDSRRRGGGGVRANRNGEDLRFGKSIRRNETRRCVIKK